MFSNACTDMQEVGKFGEWEAAGGSDKEPLWSESAREDCDEK